MTMLFTNDYLHCHLINKHKITLSLYRRINLRPNSSKTKAKLKTKVTKQWSGIQTERPRRIVQSGPLVICLENVELDPCFEGGIRFKTKRRNNGEMDCDLLDVDPLSSVQSIQEADNQDATFSSDRTEAICRIDHVETVHKEDFHDLKQIGTDDGSSDKASHRCLIIIIPSLTYMKYKNVLSVLATKDFS
jgi:hypothetical protein